MSLAACVYCDCFERGRLRTPPPQSQHVFVAADGSLDTDATDLDAQLLFDQWCFGAACEHEYGVLLDHAIGNISLVAILREELSRHPDTFPILLHKILYDGIHCGDFLTLDDVSCLQRELEILAWLPTQRQENDDYLRDFHRKMSELVRTSLDIRKPIVF